MKIVVDGMHIEANAEVPREGGRVILAHGEVTGHAHAIAAKGATLYESAGASEEALRLGTRILRTSRAVTLTHEEHSTISVPSGTWGVRIQRQYEAGAFRRVED